MRLFRSNRTEALVEELSKQVRRPLVLPTRPECIVVQGRGMEKWLGMQLADQLGIWANAEFPFPRHLVERVLVACGVAEEKALEGYQPDQLLWLIAAQLLHHAEDPLFEEVTAYVEGPERDARLLELSRRLALLFDDYAVRRPELVTEWESQDAPEHWQASLWRQIVQHLGPGHMTHGVREAMTRLDDPGGVAWGALPERISLFGICTLPPIYMRLLAKLSTEVPIDLYLLTPTHHHWSDLRSEGEILRAITRATEPEGGQQRAHHLEQGHPLVASLGKVGRDFVSILDDVLDDTEGTSLFEESASSSHLHQLQRDMLRLHHREGQSPLRFDEADQSVRVHCCHSPLREVEVLHDQLLGLLERHGDLDPRDIVVMAPQIDRYAPLIEAVFGHISADPSTPTSEPGGARRPRLPFRVTDRMTRREGSAAHALLAILAILDGRFGASEVIGLLSQQAIRGQFDISLHDITTLAHWIKESGVFWGVDEAHHESFGLPPYVEHSWRFGVERLLLGHAFADESEDFFEGRLPGPGEEGSPAGLLGRFVDFYALLAELQGAVKRALPIDEWAHILLTGLRQLIHEDEENAAEHRWIRETLGSMTRAASNADFSLPLGMRAMRSLLQARLERDGRANLFGYGGVTFCELLPMRSVPFRVVCLLGMNENDFPRDDPGMSFDLRVASRRPGDRSVRDDDRYLFLEALLSAREAFWISYVGRSDSDGSVRPPSVLVGTLLDTVRDTFNLDDSAPLITEHKLHPFHPAYFDETPELFSYAAHHCIDPTPREPEAPPSLLLVSDPLPKHEPEGGIIELAALQRFFSRPVETFLKKQLGLHWPEEGASLDDREPFRLEQLLEWKVGDQAISLLQSGVTRTELLRRFIAEGRLPPGQAGTCALDLVLEHAEPITEAMLELRGGLPAATLGVDIGLEDYRIVGSIEGVYGTRLLRHSYSKPSSDRALRLWIEHLALQCSEHAEQVGEAVYRGRGGGVRFREVEGPLEHLRGLVEVYLLGHMAPLPIFPTPAAAFAEAIRKPDSSSATAWAATRRSISQGLRADVAAKTAWRSSDPFRNGTSAMPSFVDLAPRVFEGLLEYREKLK